MSRSANEYTPVVLEIESRYIRGGFAGEPEPYITLETSAPHPFEPKPNQWPPFLELNNRSLTPQEREDLVTELVKNNPEYQVLSDIYARELHQWIPLNGAQSQIAQDWYLSDLMLDLFRDHLIVSPRKCKVILIDRCFSIATTLKILDVLLNVLKVKSVLLNPVFPSCVISTNERDGLVLDFGWEALTLCPIVDLRDTSRSINEYPEFGGLSLHYMVVLKLIQIGGPAIDTLLGRGDLFEIVEKFMRSMDAEKQPDDTVFIEDIEVSALLKHEILDEMIFANDTFYETIELILDKANLDTRPALLRNIVITGEMSNIRGFRDRIIREIRARFKGKQVGGTVPLGAWSGCSLYVSSTLARADKSVWKQEEITRDKLAHMTTETGLKLTSPSNKP